MEITFTLIVALVIGITEVIKRLGTPKKFLPVIALVIGVVISYLTGFDWVSGIVAGLSASGIWSGLKTTMGK
ncbi:hypothetical protein E6Q11_03210 [Candidatus Dojkabacteria bacterium]|uniref:Holin n=1 Tax=Candidatus Dojkabacteria bacterium TaxID=2099670 RepID=A0A5C7J6T9_9BACT|nr:MAG: hypothetical protein E6Q11_03210 [Candidatus Dojkabacteria bacterium]